MRKRDLNWYLYFYKVGKKIDEIRLGDPDANDAVSTAIEDFETKHGVTSWKEMADEYQRKSVDLG
jgi:hypothetical protein